MFCKLRAAATRVAAHRWSPLIQWNKIKTAVVLTVLLKELFMLAIICIKINLFG
jgi:hypothetical protein